MKHLALVMVAGIAACSGKPAPPAAVAVATPTAETQAAAPEDVAAARAFLARVYASYYPEAPPDSQLPDTEVYTQALIQAMQANSDAYAGDVGYLDGDPLCDCQDIAQDLRQMTFDISPLAGGKLRASVALNASGQPLSLRLTLERQGDDWRIGDVTTVVEPSLLRALEEDTAAAHSEPAAAS